MPVVPLDEVSTVQQEPIPGRAIPRFSDEASPQEFGYGLGAGLEGAARDVSQVERQQQAAQQRLQDKANADADRVRLAGAITSLSKTRDGLLFGTSADDPDAAYVQSGRAIANMPETYGLKFDQAAQDIASTLTPHQQSLFAERVAEQKDSFDLQLRRYQMEQGNREAAETFANAKAQSIQSASINYRDPAATPQAREDLFNAGMALASRGGKNEIQAYSQSGYAHDLDQLHEGVIGANLADGNIQGAQRYLAQWGNDLSSGTVRDALQNRITAAQDRLEAKGKETARDAYEDALKGGLAGIANASALVSDRQLQLLHPQTWQRERQFLNNAADTGATEKRYDTMTPAAIQADVASRATTTAAPGIANDLQLDRMRQEAAQRSITRRTADPAQFAITSGQGWQPLDFKDPQAVADQLTTRAQTAPQISQQIGVPVPLLSKPEAQALGQGLDAQAPAQRLAALTQLHASLPDERAYFSVLQQILPHSPVTAIVGQKIDRPSQWDNSTPGWYDPNFAPKVQDGERILTGESLLNPHGKSQEEKGSYRDGFPMPSNTGGAGLESFFANNTADVFKNRPQLADAHFAAFRDAYAALSSEQGDLSGQYSYKRAQQALKIAVGTPVSFNGANVVPPNGLDPRQFESTVRTTVAASAQAYGAPDDWEKRIKGYQLHEVGAVGSGRYELVNGNAPLTRPDGKGTFIIDLNQQHAPSTAP